MSFASGVRGVGGIDMLDSNKNLLVMQLVRRYQISDMRLLKSGAL